MALPVPRGSKPLLLCFARQALVAMLRMRGAWRRAQVGDEVARDWFPRGGPCRGRIGRCRGLVQGIEAQPVVVGVPVPYRYSETPTTPTTDNPRPPLPGRLGQTASNPAKASQPGPERSSGMPLADCLVLLEEAQERLWRPEGASALASLQERGLTDETIRVSRLGFVDSVSIPTRKGDHCFRARGVVIPWFDGDRLALVKIRQPEGSKPKYAEAYRDRPTIFPSLAAVRPGRPLIVTEGEFDCLLLAQELGELAAVVTLGSASAARPRYPRGDAGRPGLVHRDRCR